METIEDIRKIMQDFLAPQLRAIEERLKALETGLREFRTDVPKRIEEREAQVQREPLPERVPQSAAERSLEDLKRDQALEELKRDQKK